MLNNVMGYRLNESSLADLERKVPPEIVSRLRPLAGKGFSSRSEFSRSVQAALGDVTAPPLAVILNEGKRFQIKRVGRFFDSVRHRYLAASPFPPSLRGALALRPFFFTLWFRARWMKYAALTFFRGKNAVRRLAGQTDAYIDQDVLPYNMGQVLNFYDAHRYRTERVILLLKVLCGKHAAAPRLLSVGPRNEAELLLFNLYGFPLKNITGIDLFTYSPHIRIMDMHKMEFADNSFDIYYSAYTLAYSENVKTAVAEAIRVTRDGGLIALTMTLRGVALLAGRPSSAIAGAAELIDLFQPHVDHVYWQENFEWNEGPGADDEHRYVTVIFSIKKS